MNNLQKSSWSADHLRVSLFSTQIWAIPSDELFQFITETPPDTVTSRPASHEMSSTGVWQSMLFEVKRSVNRLDFIIQATPQEGATIALFENVNDVLTILTKKISDWIGTQEQGINRIAIGWNAYKSEENAKEAYCTLKDFVKILTIEDNKFKDFNLQVNIPVASSSIPEITINRLTNAAVILVRSELVGLENSNKFFDEKFFFTCRLDINTSAERIENIPINSIGGLIAELCESANNILVNGIQ